MRWITIQICLVGSASGAASGDVVQDGTVTATDTLTITAEKSIYGEGTMTADKAVLSTKAGDAELRVGFVINFSPLKH